jgi:hypothetical protein
MAETPEKKGAPRSTRLSKTTKPDLGIDRTDQALRCGITAFQILGAKRPPVRPPKPEPR